MSGLTLATSCVVIVQTLPNHTAERNLTPLQAARIVPPGTALPSLKRSPEPETNTPFFIEEFGRFVRMNDQHSDFRPTDPP
jgi:hypothetical protein